jgi:hypothetical protein
MTRTVVPNRPEPILRPFPSASVEYLIPVDHAQAACLLPFLSVRLVEREPLAAADSRGPSIRIDGHVVYCCQELDYIDKHRRAKIDENPSITYGPPSRSRMP